MLKTVCGGLTALCIVGTPLAYAQVPSATAPALERGTAGNPNALVESRIAVVKAALQLTPDQMKLWPPVEDAIRGRATARQQRLASLIARRKEAREFQPVEFLQRRSEVLAQRAAGLKKLADAWQPLYATLDVDQKRRMRIVAAIAIRELRNSVENRLMNDDDEEEEDEG
ncbi:MAG: hypothetical protein JWM36_1209 [Hyphomicrobiales bacterium]|nr:hypothetical protein [Hyphomicrobiales bacterium]